MSLDMRQWIHLQPALGAVDLSTVVSAAGTVARSQVRRATFRSQLTGEISYDPNTPGSGSSSGGGFGNALLNFMKPELELETTFGTIRTSPRGRPTRNYLPLIAVVGVVGAAATIGMIARGFRK